MCRRISRDSSSAQCLLHGIRKEIDHDEVGSGLWLGGCVRPSSPILQRSGAQAISFCELRSGTVPTLRGLLLHLPARERRKSESWREISPFLCAIISLSPATTPRPTRVMRTFFFLGISTFLNPPVVPALDPK